ncbi:MAG: hypothetical protein NVSMB9_32450 [Isosphaeraceae bacterium]
MTGCNRRWVLILALVVASASSRGARAQAPTVVLPSSSDPGSTRSSLGPIPGAGGNPFGMSPGTDPAFLGGRPGPSFPRVPSEIANPGGQMALPTRGITIPTRMATTTIPLYGPLDLPDAAEEEGPPDGLTLDAAIERLLRENLPLLSRRWQIPQYRADVLTASLRANPSLFADGQLVPYGRFDRARPGGPIQYDLNVSHPIDYSFKRLSRTVAAERVVSVQEAQYQDAVRVQIDNVYTAFVNVLAARETLRYAQASVQGLEKVLRTNQSLYEKSNVTSADVGRVRLLLERAGLGVLQSEEMLGRAKRTLATLLNLPPAQATTLELRGTLADLAPPPPPLDELARLAIGSRPDLAARRLGIQRAEAETRLARANRFGDASLLYQPYTFQDNTPVGLKSATSWALGLTLPLPVYNRNQGGIARAHLNVSQSRTELDALQRGIISEVRAAGRDYALSRELLRRYKTDLLPVSRARRDDTFRLFAAGELTALDAYNAERDHNEVVRGYRDTLIRHRRDMLTLNTAVGRRVLP